MFTFRRSILRCHSCLQISILLQNTDLPSTKMYVHINPKWAIHIKCSKSLWLLFRTLLLQCKVNLWHPTFADVCPSSFRKQIMAIKLYSLFQFQMICLTSFACNCISKLTLVFKIKRSEEGKNQWNIEEITPFSRSVIERRK